MLRPNRRFRLEEGITLVEVIIAMFILSVALLAMASTATSSLISLAGSRDREQATNAASAAIERARALDFTDLVVPATPAVSGLPTDIQALFSITGDCADAEQIVRDAAATGGVTLEEAVGHNELFTVYTIVTWADEPCGATAGDLKRVVAIAA
ncbi:MAG: prepilin-type N-terminal cleavage/methylation domain-containing protein, partial [Actinomycetota bacterium]